MREDLRAFWNTATAPAEGFRQRALAAPTLGAAVKGLLKFRTLPAFLGMALSYLSFTWAYGRITRMEGSAFDFLWANLPPTVDQEAVRASLQDALRNLPALPPLATVLFGLALLAPLGVLSLWLHDAVWDHLALWALRGLGGRRSLRVTLEADAEALKVGTLGALVSLLGDVPGLGCLFGIVTFPVGVYFWILRGYALAAWHGCPPWKGVLATLLHAFLMGLFTFGILGLFLVMILQELRPG